MRFFKRSATEPDVAQTEWAPKLLRFFWLFVGEQALAESLTIEVIAEAAHVKGKPLAGGLPVALIRRAIERATQAPAATSPADDLVVRAVQSLSLGQRRVVSLFRGLGLTLSEIAGVTRVTLPETKRICVDGLLKVHDCLTASKKKDGQSFGARTGVSH